MVDVRCEPFRDALAAIVRGGAIDPTLERHATECQSCTRAIAGARTLGGTLASWSEPEAPESLTARTLARVRMSREIAEGERPAAPAPAINGTRRGSVELLATWALPGPKPLASGGARPRLGLRLAVQAAAAVLLFVVCTSFTAAFYPVFVDALEDSRDAACRAQLGRIGDALKRYRHDHPDAAQDPLGAYSLRDALVKGGYAREVDFACPAAHAHKGALSFHLTLPAPGSEDPRVVIAYDHLGNHSSGLNVLFADGHVVHVEADRLGKALWLRADQGTDKSKK